SRCQLLGPFQPETFLPAMLRALRTAPAPDVVFVVRLQEGLLADARVLLDRITHFLDSSCKAFEGVRLWSVIRVLTGFDLLLEGSRQIGPLLACAGTGSSDSLDAVADLARRLIDTADGQSLADAFAAARAAVYSCAAGLPAS